MNIEDFLRSKDELKEKIINITAISENEIGKEAKDVRSNNVGKFGNKQLVIFMMKKGYERMKERQFIVYKITRLQKELIGLLFIQQEQC